MVEFALLGPAFFMLIFAMLDGGLLLYSANAVDNATTVGSNALAALGTSPTTDFVTVEKMAQSGFGDNHLIRVVEIDIDGVQQSAANGFAIDPATQKPLIDTCNNVAKSCHNVYTVSVANSGDVTVTLQNPVIGAPCPYTYPQSGNPGIFGCKDPPWAPSARNVANGTSSFAALTVKYTYTYFTGIAAPLSMSAIKTLRLEPQS